VPAPAQASMAAPAARQPQLSAVMRPAVPALSTPAARSSEPAVLVLATAHRAPGGPLEAGPALLGGRDRVAVVPLARWDVEELLGGGPGQVAEAHMRFGAWVGGGC
jgi:hypothetical protein